MDFNRFFLIFEYNTVFERLGKTEKYILKAATIGISKYTLIPAVLKNNNDALIKLKKLFDGGT